jgi:hypothetical protein
MFGYFWVSPIDGKMKPLYHDEWIGFLGIFVSPETPNMSETEQFHGNSGVNFPKRKPVH